MYSRRRGAFLAALLLSLGLSDTRLGSADDGRIGGCTGRWEVVPSPNPGTTENVLFAVSARAIDDVWAVGRQYSPAATLIEHWDGTAWSVIPSESPGLAVNALNGVSAVSATDAWAVGSYTRNNRFSGLTEHWDGIRWSTIPLDNPQSEQMELADVWATSSDDVWAVGTRYSDLLEVHPLAEHWDGTKWTFVSVPTPAMRSAGFSAVWASAADDVWGIGNDYTRPLVEHWDGSSWSIVPSPPLPTSYLVSISGSSPTDVWAIGFSDDHDTSLAEHWDGLKWQPGALPWASSVTALAPTDAWTAGGTGIDTVIQHWNGSNWSRVKSPNRGSTNGLNAISAASARDVWAVGEFFSLSDNELHTLIEHFC